MTAKIGYKSYVGFGEEASLATAVAPSQYLEYNSEGFKKEIEEKLIDAISGGRQYTKRITLNQSVSGSLTFPLVPGTALKLFKHLSGDGGTVTTLTTGVYQHTFVFGSNLTNNTSFTFQVCRDTADTATTYNYIGCKVNSASFTNAVNEILSVNLELMGVNQISANTISTASYRTQNPYTFVNGTIKLGDNLSALTTTSINSFNLTIGQNLQDARSIGSAVRDVIEPAMQDVTYELSSRYENANLVNRFLNGTKTAIQAIYDTGITISSTYTHKMTLESANCYFNGTIPNIGSANDIIKHSLPLRAIKEDASIGTLKVTIISDIASV